jgi:hypothetical protein
MPPLSTPPTRRLTAAAMLGVCLLLQGCLAIAVVGTAASVGGAVVGAVVKGGETVGKAVIPLTDPGPKVQAQP